MGLIGEDVAVGEKEGSRAAVVAALGANDRIRVSDALTVSVQGM